MNEGWLCPKCNTVNAPFMMQCPNCVGDKPQVPFMPTVPMGFKVEITKDDTAGETLLTEHNDKNSY